MKHPLRPALVVVAALVFLSLDHGMPHRYVPDDSAVKCALGIARDLGADDVPLLQRVVPPAGHYTTYPYLLPYLDLAAIGVNYGLGRVFGWWGGTGEYGMKTFDDWSLAWVPARIVTALLALLLPLAVYRAARELGRAKGEAALAALLGGTSLLFVQYAHTTRPWAPMVAFGACALAASLRMRRKRRARDGALAAGFAALSASCHPVGVLAFGLPVLAALLFRPGWKPVAAGLLVGGAVTLLVGAPYLLVYGGDAGVGAISGGQVQGGLEIGGQVFDLSFISGRLLSEVSRSWFGYDPVLILAGLLGLFLLARARLGPAAVLVILPAVFHTALFLLYDGSHVRYLMPAVPFLAIGAAATLAGLARRRGPARLLAALLVALPIVQAARLDYLLGRLDTRTEMVARIEALTGPGDVIAVDHQGFAYAPPLVPTAQSLLAVETLVELTSKEKKILEGVRVWNLPEPAEARTLVPLTRFWIFDSYYPTDYSRGEDPVELADFLDARGVNVYVQVDRLPDEQRRLPVTALMAARGTLVDELSPTGSSLPDEAALPTDMAFALTALWTYERPGPWIRVWRLAP